MFLIQFKNSLELNSIKMVDLVAWSYWDSNRVAKA